MGAAIIGYRPAFVPRAERALYAVASILLVVPALFLSPVETLFGLPTGGLSVSLIAHGVGGVLLAVLVISDRRRKQGTDVEPNTGVDATPSADA